MTRFTCRGFEGKCIEQIVGRQWYAEVRVAGVAFWDVGYTPAAAKARVRRKLDAVERALRGRWRRHG